MGPGQSAQVPYTGWQGASSVTAGSSMNLPQDNGPSGHYWTPTVISYQAQLGSLFFPQQPITSAEEQYMNALYVFGKSLVDKDENCSVTKEDFFGVLVMACTTAETPSTLLSAQSAEEANPFLLSGLDLMVALFMVLSSKDRKSYNYLDFLLPMLDYYVTTFNLIKLFQITIVAKDEELMSLLNLQES